MAETPIRVGAGIERRYRGADRRATECVVNLLRTESLVAGALTRCLRTRGLSVATFNVLMILEGAREPLCPNEIGERLLVTRGTVTGLLDSLERQGRIRRAPHPGDRRMLLIQITDRGRRALDELLPEHFSGEADMMSPLAAREKETLVRLLGKIQAHLRREAPGR